MDVTATAVDDGTIVGWRWMLTGQPDGSAAGGPSPANTATTSFTPDIAGVYQLTVTATDDDGMTGMCTTQVNAGNVDGLRVEMFWDTDGTDMDTHLMDPTGTQWASHDDCYYGNCQSGSTSTLEWGAPGPDDNPRLDIDDTNGFGPENINITRPQPGTYRVAIHNYRGTGPNHITVSIYCGGSTTSPRQTFHATLRGRGSSTDNDFWRVADVEITPGACTITDSSLPTGPWVEVYSTTMNMR